MRADSSQDEPKRLTQEEHAGVWRKLWEIGLNRWNAEELAGVRAVSNHIAALDAELAAAHAVIAELTAAGIAGLRMEGDFGPEWSCDHCDATARWPEEFPHDPDCPIVKGRALLKGAEHDD